MDQIKFEPAYDSSEENLLKNTSMPDFYANHQVKVEIKEEAIPVMKIEKQVVDGVGGSNTELNKSDSEEEVVIIESKVNECNHHTLSLVHKDAGYLPYKCDICGKLFTWRSSYRFHMLLHNGIKSYTCNICNEQFFYDRQLKRHKFTHTGIKPLSCPICDKTFFEKYQLKRHLQVHTKTVGHSVMCYVCNVPFSNNESLKRHNILHHSAESSIVLQTVSTSNLSSLQNYDMSQTKVNSMEPTY